MTLKIIAVGFEMNPGSTSSGTLAIVADSDVESVKLGLMTYPFFAGYTDFTVDVTAGSGVYEMTGLQPNAIIGLRLTGFSQNNLGGTSGTTSYFSVFVPSTSNSVVSQTNTTIYQYNGTESIATKNKIDALIASSATGVSGTDAEEDLKEIDTGITLGTAGTVSKSLLSISTADDDPQTISMAIKATGIAISPTKPAYYAFGTTMFFKPTTTESKQSGGIGLFVNETGNTGYFLNIRTTETASSRGDTEVRLFKVNKGNNIQIPDSQVLNTASQIKGIYGPESYKVDINVKVTETKISFIIFINGFKITASDTQKTPASIINNILAPTANIGLYASLGTTNFDYVYAMPISSDQYTKSDLMNIYGDEFASATSSMAYGDLFVSGLANTTVGSNQPFIHEFGPVAREIRNLKFRYSATPAFPKYPTAAGNKFIKILGHNLSSFNAEMYILNNAGTYIPLNSDTKSTISILGNSIDQSSPLEYMDKDLNKYSTQEPITFDSKWIQKYDDAKNLSTWIKTQLKNQQLKIRLSVFGQPLISVGDIISVVYQYNELAGTEKFLVTNVEQSWSEGLETTLEARSIYS